MTMAVDTRAKNTRYIVNDEFTQAALFFEDESRLEFEHTPTSRWAKSSTEGSMADEVCRSLQSFRLNAKHLQLFFTDGSNAEFHRDG
ncbi:MAG: hypothetical protein CME19_18000 [Gemmatimonadetes bacterium]|nr:hypothetical protein [Gemmatimonadota bacterium]|tara:strand:+ start:1086 stop:1346 length:261 start_codon:yes stop_codon:yes gene_type:complete